MSYGGNGKSDNFSTNSINSMNSYGTNKIINKNLKIDVIGYDNKYIMAYIKKSSKSNSTKKSTTNKQKI